MHILDYSQMKVFKSMSDYNKNIKNNLVRLETNSLPGIPTEKWVYFRCRDLQFEF